MFARRARGVDEVPSWLTDGHFARMRDAYLVTLRNDKREFALATSRQATGVGAAGRRLWVVPDPDADPGPEVEDAG